MAGLQPDVLVKAVERAEMPMLERPSMREQHDVEDRDVDF
jgi:hypothetical protein